MYPEYLIRLAASLTDRKVLVTGGAGFIGSNLVRLLVAAGCVPHLILRSRTDCWRLDDIREHIVTHYADLCVEDAFANHISSLRPEVLFHLATARGSDTQARGAMLRMNVASALAIIGSAPTSGVHRVVVAGSSLEYGPSDSALGEDAPLAPRTWHGAAKAAAHLLYQQAALTQGLSVALMRLFHVYGPWESHHRLAPTAISVALGGGELRMTHSCIRRDWVFVDDVIEALLLAASSRVSPLVLNIGSGEECSNEEFVDHVIHATGCPIQFGAEVYPVRVSDVAHRRADITRAWAELGWRPRHDIVAGISRTLAWMRDYPEAYARDTGDRPCLL